ncbi:hypothetical protein ACWC1D_37125, partial [Streptomyces sp. NPDC001478]
MAERGAVIAARGHEAADGSALDGLAADGVNVVPAGRALFRTVTARGRRGEETVVVPMTLGREPGLVAETARTLRRPVLQGRLERLRHPRALLQRRPRPPGEPPGR